MKDNKDRDEVLAAVKQDGWALEYADESLKKDKEIVMAAVKQDGFALQYAATSLKKDKEIVMAAINALNLPEFITNSPEGYESLAIELARSKDNIKAPEDMEDYEMYDVHGELHGTSRDEIMEGLANFKLDLDQYEDFPKEMWKDEEVIYQSIIAGNHLSELMYYVHESLWRDKGFVIGLLKYAERYNECYDIEGAKVKDYIHESLIDNNQVKQVLDSYIDNLGD